MATIYDFSVDQGATKKISLTYRFQSGVDENEAPVYEPYSLSGCAARMQVRPAVNQPVLIDLSTEAGSIVVEPGGVQGRIDIVMSATQTSALEVRKAVYDLELVWPSGEVTRLIQGKVTISPNVTE